MGQTKPQPKTVVSDELAKAFGGGGMTWGDLPPIVLEKPKEPEPPKQQAEPVVEEKKVEV